VFKKLDGNSLISLMFRVVSMIRIKRNPVTSRPLITNIWTQLLANRILTIRAEWKQNGVKEPIRIELDNFAPTRDPKTGVYDRNLTEDIRKHYQMGLPDSELAVREFGYLLSYFTACFTTGKLPTPSKPSGQSTIMAKIVQIWREEAGVNPNWIEIVSKSGVVKRVNRNVIDSIQTVFVANFDEIVETWDTGDSRQKNSGNRIEWL